MRPVNLLPERYRPARATGRLRGSAYITVGVLTVLLLMVLGYVMTQNSINDAKEKENEAIAEAQVAEARAAQLGSFGNFQQVKEQREAAVKGLALTRFDYERLMREMALVLPRNVFLTTFTATPGGVEGDPAAAATVATGPSLALTGCAPTHPDVSTTIVRLRRMNNVTDVALVSSTKASAQGEAGCKVTWTANVTFEPEAAAPDRAPVPARIGGGA